MVFTSSCLKMPYYLWKSLTKMERTYQTRIINIETSLFHHGLICILVENHLAKIGDDWATFVTRNGFLPKPIS
jgi:hypothetical protein